jgi:hypothetical protein
MTIRWWYVPPGSVPADPAGQYQWLRVQWALVDSWIGARKAQSGLAAAAPALAAAEPVAAADPVPGISVAGEEPSPDGDPLLDTPG